MTTQPPLPDSAPLESRRVVRCRLCGRPLTDPGSRLRGEGPTCGHEGPLTPRGWQVEQDKLPGL